MDVFAALHAIDDGADHDGEIHENAAHAHETLSAGMHGTADEFFNHGIAPDVGPFRPDACWNHFAQSLNIAGKSRRGRKIVRRLTYIFCFSRWPRL